MKKKLYIVPESEISELMPMAIICASITNGGDAGEDITGD